MTGNILITELWRICTRSSPHPQTFRGRANVGQCVSPAPRFGVGLLWWGRRDALPYVGFLGEGEPATDTGLRRN
jgi:hypothetical protein